MKEAFVGFDSAWAGKQAGAISYAVFRDAELERLCLPRAADFADAARIINRLQQECDDVLVAIDQPIIVKNSERSRRVDRVAGRLMRTLHSGTQPANTSKETMFGENAPVWRFIKRITPDHMTCRDLKDFGNARTSTAGETHLIEVYPALALPALDQRFMDRGSAARYNPQSTSKDYPFCPADWKLVCEIVHTLAEACDLPTLAQWADEMMVPWDAAEGPKKPHQDKIDAAICLLISLAWRYENNQLDLHAFGKLECGCMVTPVSKATRAILEPACRSENVDFY